MMGGNHKFSISPEEYIFAAIAIYLDILNLFLHILKIVAAARRKWENFLTNCFQYECPSFYLVQQCIDCQWNHKDQLQYYFIVQLEGPCNAQNKLNILYVQFCHNFK